MRQYLIAVLITGVVVFMLDLILDSAIDTSSTDTLIGFTPFTNARFRTSEFDSKATINRFGFRGNEETLDAGQIVAVGDSFTFGWANQDDETWPSLLQKRLASSQLPLRVYNLGEPGTDTEFHIRLAEEYVRKVRPRYVVLSILMDDDIQQVYERSYLGDVEARSTTERIKDILRHHLKGYYKIYKAAKGVSSTARQGPDVSVMQNWSHDALDVISRYTMQLPQDILREATAGNVNPGYLRLAARFPRRTQFYADLAANPDAQQTLASITAQLKALTAAVKANGGELIVFGMPSCVFVKSKATENFRQFGFNIPEANLATLDPETTLRKVAAEAGARFVGSLSDFRKHSNSELFYPIDGHLTVEGNRLVSDLLSSALLSSDARK